MITNENKRTILKELIEELDLPESAYENAQKRYEDLGNWFDRDESLVAENNPHIFSQGSFRLGTAIRPLDNTEEYDLDLACKLRVGITKRTHTQKDLKELIQKELEAYRKARGIHNELEEKHRCWRLEYKDDLSFHMDIVPCIPEDENKRNLIFDSLQNKGMSEQLANVTSQTTVSITDDRHHDYPIISNDWKISNPEGYSEWFESRMVTQQPRVFMEKAQVDRVPLFKRKSSLQRVIQLLKRHRDSWSKDNPDSKPISIIITTLAAKAYNGEINIDEALQNILNKMDSFVNPAKPRIPNPIDPDEDFADRWYREDCKHLMLEETFNSWLMQAKIDFAHMTSTTDTKFLVEHGKNKFSLNMNESKLRKSLGLSAVASNIVSPKSHSINKKDTPNPWKS